MTKIAYLIVAASLVSAAGGVEQLDDRDGSNLIAGNGAGLLRPTLDQGVVDGCLMCHRGQLTLSGADPEVLADAIADISQGRFEHLVPVPELSDADRAALAEALAAAEP